MYWFPSSIFDASGVVASPVSGGTLLKADFLVDLEQGLSMAGNGDLAIGESRGNSGAYPQMAYDGSIVYPIAVKLFFPMYPALLTGGSLTMRGYPLYGVTGGYLSVTNPGNANPVAVSSQTQSIVPDQLVRVYKVYVS